LGRDVSFFVLLDFRFQKTKKPAAALCRDGLLRDQQREARVPWSIYYDAKDQRIAEDAELVDMAREGVKVRTSKVVTNRAKALDGLVGLS